MTNEPALNAKTFRLEEAYQKMSPEGRAALDRLTGQLAELHRQNTELFLNPNIAHKQLKIGVKK